MKHIFLSALACVLLSFNLACSNTGFNSVQSGSMALASSSVSDIINLGSLRADSSDHRIVELAANTGIFNKPVASLYWDHVFEDDLIFCQQSSNTEDQRVTFLCPAVGLLKVILTVTFADGEVYSESLSVDLSGNLTPLPTPPPSVALTGAELYITYCMGCHGGLTTSSKRGISLSQLNSGLNSVPTMNALRDILSNEQRQKIVDALK